MNDQQKTTTETPYERRLRERREREAAAGRTRWVARCGCYAGHGSTSGRCHARDFYVEDDAPSHCPSCRDFCGR